MELSIKVCTEAKCSVIIQDKTPIGDNGYIPESQNTIAQNRFKYSETIAIDVLQLNKSTGAEIQDSIFSIRDKKESQIRIPVSFDGWFTIYHIVLPNATWFENELKKTSASAIQLYDVIYYSDGLRIYKYINEKSIEVTLDEVINRNTNGTTISITNKDYVSICFLRKCYINLCQQLFNLNLLTECYNSNDKDCELSYHRDLVWMTLNVIQYLTELNQLAEAERIIEQIGRGCNGLCKQTMERTSKSGCGCS